MKTIEQLSTESRLSRATIYKRIKRLDEQGKLSENFERVGRYFKRMLNDNDEKLILENVLKGGRPRSSGK